MRTYKSLFITEAILKPTPGESQEEEEVRAPSGEAVNSCLVLSGEENKVCVLPMYISYTSLTSLKIGVY